jgi:hypothetical protein
LSFGSNQPPKVPAVVERFLKQLVITYKAVLLYPIASNIPQENAAQTVKVLHEILEGSPEVRLSVAKSAVFYGGVPVFAGEPAFESFARELYNRRIAEVRFHSGTRADHIARFLDVLKHAPEELAESGGVPGQLWEMGVDSITVTEASAKIVGEALIEEDQDPGEAWPPEPRRVQEIIANAYGDSPRDQRLLVRVIHDPDAVASYIHGTIAERGGTGGEGGVLTRFMELVHLAAEQSDELQSELFKALADAVEKLPESERRELLSERLLPEARTDDSLAAVLRRLDIDEVCHLLVEGLDQDEIATDGLARAIRNLAMISLAERDEVINAAGAAMRQAGQSEEVVNEVLESAAPSFLTLSGESQPVPEQEEPESVLQLLNIAPTKVAKHFEDDATFVSLQEESRRGVSDGDVARTLVSIVSVDATGDSFPSIMTLAESSIELLIERGEYDVAADTARSLEEASQTPGLPEDRVLRIQGALTGLASVKNMRAVSKAMRMYEHGSAEHAACMRLLTTLGSEAIDPLLELVADEPDMASRKQLVDLVSQMAAAFIEELSARVTDERWYVVRNVVMILGKTHDPEILPALGRTLRHSDDRVRRETIRALSTVQDRLASEMLIAALSDSDSQNVQLAARYLGTTRAKGAVRALCDVANGNGAGNRETAARVEAIEALGRIGSPEALPVLEQLAERRGGIRRARTREISAAAESAIVVIRNSGGAS